VVTVVTGRVFLIVVPKSLVTWPRYLQYRARIEQSLPAV